MMEKFRTYMVVGGMPQVVDEFLRTNNLMRADIRKREILELYRSDLVKMTEVKRKYALALFEGIPSLLSSRSKRFFPGKFLKGSRSRSFAAPISSFNEAKMTLPCYSCNDPDVTVNLTVDRSPSKLNFPDTDPLFSLAFGKRSSDLGDAYKSLVVGKLSINEGMFFENMVSQQLASVGYDLIFHTFDSDGNTYEVDFLIPGRKGICPIDVRSSQSSRPGPWMYSAKGSEGGWRHPMSSMARTSGWIMTAWSTSPST